MNGHFASITDFLLNAAGAVIFPLIFIRLYVCRKEKRLWTKCSKFSLKVELRIYILGYGKLSDV